MSHETSKVDLDRGRLGMRLFIGVYRSLAFGLILTLLIQGATMADAPNWKVGLASVKITPDEPVRMSGYASRTQPFQVPQVFASVA